MTRLEDEAFADVPVFPLPNVVLFPEAVLPLHIFEPRYRAMLSDCLDHDGAIVIAQLDRDGARIAEVAAIGVVIEHQPLPDGRSNIVVAGSARVRLDEIRAEEPPRHPYKRARATRLHEVDVTVNDAEYAALLTAATMFVTEVKKHDAGFELRMPKSLRGSEASRAQAGVLADICAFQLVVDAGARQAILEELDPRARVRMVTDQLAMQHGAMLSETKGSVLN
ncbi:MAG: LON peptidase substrate-binding domain-containing protein [Labilithrix sp.]|nr:LON peptidase substrate-binding domain-containing protein [Labilithrix sp.]